MPRLTTQETSEERRPHAPFSGFPAVTLLEEGDLPLTELAHIAVREGHRTSELFHVHRWFARRLTSQFRAILTAVYLPTGSGEGFWDWYKGELDLAGAVVLDPFVGGGTSAVEASRCGARVIGYDIDPIATKITTFELSAAHIELLGSADSKDCQDVADQMAPYHQATHDGELKDVLHHFWVEVQDCIKCGAQVELHPHYQLAYDTNKQLQWAFCSLCHAVAELPLDSQTLACECGNRTSIATAPLSNGTIICPACQYASDLSERGRSTGVPPSYRLFAQEYVEKVAKGKPKRKFRAVTEADQQQYQAASQHLRLVEGTIGRVTPERPIPTDGRSDQRPIIHGITSYRQLFNDRQLLHLTLLGRRIADLSDGVAKEVMGIAFSEHLTTNSMYTSYAFGYRRVSQMLSMHSFRHITRPVELNPWLSGIGRGTFPNTLRKVAKAVAFAKYPQTVTPTGRSVTRRPVGPQDGVVSNRAGDVVRGEADAAVVTQSSVELAELPDGSVDLILTDPPYFNNVSYSELSDFYLYWHQGIGIARPPYEDVHRAAPLQENLAVADNSIAATEEYRASLRQVFCECCRVLKQDGLMVFTYHHRYPKAWLAVAEALHGSGFRISKVVPMRGEGQGGLCSRQGTIKWDAVFVCRRTGLASQPLAIPLHISDESVQDAFRQVAVYGELIGDDPKAGFHEPDRTNFLRALFVAAAIGTETPVIASLPLELALRMGWKSGNERFFKEDADPVEECYRGDV